MASESKYILARLEGIKVSATDLIRFQCADCYLRGKRGKDRKTRILIWGAATVRFRTKKARTTRKYNKLKGIFHFKALASLKGAVSRLSKPVNLSTMPITCPCGLRNSSRAKKLMVNYKNTASCPINIKC